MAGFREGVVGQQKLDLARLEIFPFVKDDGWDEMVDVLNRVVEGCGEINTNCFSSSLDLLYISIKINLDRIGWVSTERSVKMNGMLMKMKV